MTSGQRGWGFVAGGPSGGDDVSPDAGPAGACRSLGRVVTNQPLGTMTRLITSVPGWRTAAAGQFALLQAEPSRCFLARPLSVSDEAGEKVSFLIAPVGDGTRELCALREGDRVWVLGPLGKGFAVDTLLAGPGRVVLVGGGAGVAPFPLLLFRLLERYRTLRLGPAGGPLGQPPQDPSAGPAGLEVVVVLGFRDDAQAACALPVRQAASLVSNKGMPCRVEVAVEDGSRGPTEKVTDLLERRLRPGDRLAVCGPDAMSRAVWGLCRRVPGVEAWFSLEGRMACGVGSCHGCLLTRADGSSARVCYDGPVFGGQEIFGV